MKLETAMDLAHITTPEMLIDPILPKGSITCVAGPTYSGKTFFALEAARAVAFGQSFMHHWPAKIGNVLFLEQDAPKYDTGRAMFAMLRPIWPSLLPDGHSHPARALRFAWHPGLDLSTPSHRDIVISTANGLITPLGFYQDIEVIREGTALIIIDTLRAFHSADENSSTEMQAVMYNLSRLRDATGAAVLFLHHTTHPIDGREYRPRGSTAIEGACDNIFLVTKSKKDDAIRVKIKKARAVAPPNFSYTVHTDEDGPLGLTKTVSILNPNTSQSTSNPEDPFLIFTTWYTPNATVADVMAKFGVSRSTAHRWLKKMGVDTP